MAGMVQDFSLGGYLIPAYVVSAAAAVWVYVWTHLTEKRVASLESSLRIQEDAFRSTLRRQEEAFRLVHSPRVTGAVRLWASFCEFERALRQCVSPGRVVVEPPNATPEQKEQALREQVAQERKTVVDAWQQFKTIRDEAEVLLPGDVFAAFNSLYLTFERAFGRKRAEEMVRSLGSGTYFIKVMEEVEALMTEADAKRPAVVDVMRKLISGIEP